jgi:hypothetical protein
MLFMGSLDDTDPLRSQLSHYQAGFTDLGQEFYITGIPLKPAFNLAKSAKPLQHRTEDRVHPTAEDHMLIDLTIL